jgi:alpha-ketoglutarate-dependent 2,4-dichlorophenoxyacetate dioxygenase
MNSASIDPNQVDTAGLRVTPFHPTFVGQVFGLDVGRGISDAQRDAIDAAMDRFAVLVFPGQALDDTQLFAFGSRFGTVEDAASGTHQDRRRIVNAQINDISNWFGKSQERGDGLFARGRFVVEI